MIRCDVLIIGAGLTGCAAAMELSRYELDIAVVEKGADVASGASRANSAVIHAGYDCAPGTLMARLNVSGNVMMESLCARLSVPFRRTGSLVIAFDDAQREHLMRLRRQGEQNGAEGLEILSGGEARRIEPALNPSVTTALWAPSAAIVCPYELTLAMAENAAENGTRILTGWELAAVERGADGFTAVSARGDRIRARFIVNAAGVNAGTVSALAGGMPIAIVPRRGEYLVLDRAQGGTARTVIFQTPSTMGKGVLVSPTVHGNLLVGPSAQDISDGEDAATTAQGLDTVRATAPLSVPGVRLDQVIRTFAGVRAVLDGKHDFLISPDPKVKGLVHAAGICSPGLSAAPAIAKEIAGLLRSEGLPLQPKRNYSDVRVNPKPFRDMDERERRAAIAADPRYGRVICRCETVTEAEVLRAVRSRIPALTLDAVKWRTRAGMGRCQGGFCAPRVMEILAREQGVTLDRITKSGGGSWIVRPKTGAGKEAGS